MPGSIRSSTTRSAGWSRSSSQRALAVGRLVDLVPGRAQVGDHHLADGQVVVDHQHPGHRHLLVVARRRVGARRRPPRTPTTSVTSTEPAEPVVPVQQGRVVRAGAEAAEHGDRRAGSPAEHHQPDHGAGAAAAAAAAGRPGAPRPAPAARGRASCSTTPPTSQSQASSGCWPRPRSSSSHTPYAAQRRRRRRQPTSGPRASRGHLEPGDPLGLQHAGPVRARSAGTGSRGRATAARRRGRSASSVRGSSEKLPASVLTR